MKKFILAICLFVFSINIYSQEPALQEETLCYSLDPYEELSDQQLERRKAFFKGLNQEQINEKLREMQIVKESNFNLSGSLKLLSKVYSSIGVTEENFSGTVFGKVKQVSIIRAVLTSILAYLIGCVFINLIFKFLYGILLKIKFLKVKEKPFKVIKRPLKIFILLMGVRLAFLEIALSLDIILFYLFFFRFIVLLAFFWGVLVIYDVLTARLDAKFNGHSNLKDVAPLLRKVIRVLIIIASMLIIFDKMGGNVRAFIVSLGIGGAALAFASKDTIANFFGSISLIMDKPFGLEDRIEISGKVDGVVESIGIRSTRVRNLDQTLSILPNSILANEYIKNISSRNKRKVGQNLGVVYSTNKEQMLNILAGIKDAIKEEDVDKDDIYVNFDGFGDSALTISVIYFINTTSYAVYQEIKQRINLKIMKVVEENGSSFAFPTVTVCMDK